jgi:hypothetical protein
MYGAEHAGFEIPGIAGLSFTREGIFSVFEEIGPKPSSEDKYCTITEYARYKGVTQQAVSFAIAQGRFPHYIEQHGRKLIDWRAAEADPHVNIGARLRAKGVPLFDDDGEVFSTKSIARPEPAPQMPRPSMPSPEPEEQPKYRKGISPKTQAAQDTKQRILEAQARISEAQAARIEGLVLDRAPAESIILDFFSRYAELVQQLPSQAAAKVAGNPSPEAISLVIRSELEKLTDKLRDELEKKKAEIQQLANSQIKPLKL